MIPETFFSSVPKAAIDMHSFSLGNARLDETVEQTCRLVAPLLQADQASTRRFAKCVLRAAEDTRRYLQTCEKKQLPAAILTPRQLRRAKEYMIEHLSRKISVKEIAAECQLSASHFSRSFRVSSGTTPHHWLLKQRIVHAEWLLKNSHLSIPEITLECGFTHRVAFSKAFSRLTGKGPSSWRREHQDVRSVPASLLIDRAV